MSGFGSLTCSGSDVVNVTVTASSPVRLSRTERSPLFAPENGYGGLQG